MIVNLKWYWGSWVNSDFWVKRFVGLFIVMCSMLLFWLIIRVCRWRVWILGSSCIVLILMFVLFKLIKGRESCWDKKFNICCFDKKLSLIRVLLSLWLVFFCMVSVCLICFLVMMFFLISRLFSCLCNLICICIFF